MFGSRARFFLTTGSVAGALLVVACSVGLPTSYDDYARAHTGEAGVVLNGSLDGGPSCAPANDPSFPKLPDWVPPRARQNVCTQQQIIDIIDCTFSADGTPPTSHCTTVLSSTANQACNTCLHSTTADQQAGPIIEDPSFIALNVNGCVALASGDISAGGCGRKFQIARYCELALCSQCLEQDGHGFEDCVAAAKAGVCAPYDQAAQCATPYAAQCPQDLVQDPTAATKVAQYFCGPPS